MNKMDRNMEMNHEHNHETPEEKEMTLWKKRLVWGWIATAPIIFFMYILPLVFGMMVFSEEVNIILSIIFAFPVIFLVGFSTLKSDLTGFLGLFYGFQNYSGISAMIMAIFVTGKYVESKARGKAGQEIRKLLEL